MRTYLDCVPCFFRQALFSARIAGLDETSQKKVLEDVSRLVIDLPMDLTPAQVGRSIYKLVLEAVGTDPFREIKEKSNRLALSLYPELKKKVDDSEDRLLTAVELAIAGNVIDYGVKNTLNIEREIEKILAREFSIGESVFDYEGFRDMLSEVTEVLYLADNAGEILFDRILIEEISSGHRNVVCAVRSGPIINDALMEDAVICGIDKYARVISSGSDAPGTILELCSPEFMEIYNSAELIISKGQGNYEGLSSEEDRPIYFLLKAKCSVVADDVGCRVGDMILKSRAGSKEFARLK